DVWSAFNEQVAVAATLVSSGRVDLETLAAGWLAAMAAHEGGVAAAMASNSGLVSDANMAALEAMQAGALDADQRRLLAHHALLLDAVAASVPELAGPAADL